MSPPDSKRNQIFFFCTTALGKSFAQFGPLLRPFRGRASGEEQLWQTTVQDGMTNGITSGLHGLAKTILRGTILRGLLPCAAVIALALGSAGTADANTKPKTRPAVAQTADLAEAGIDPALHTRAVAEARAKQQRGQRVWCVPFARTASGIALSGNAATWWKAAAGRYERGHAPHAGAVMTFSATRKMPMGHVAVVSKVVSERKILLDHANWNRNKISLQMVAVDVSAKNDWSAVRLESAGGSLGSVYPIKGFIYPRILG